MYRLFSVASYGFEAGGEEGDYVSTIDTTRWQG
jgi:hypothetical protein